MKNSETIDNIIYAACILHNALRSSNIPYPHEQKETPINLPTQNFITLTPTSDRRGNYNAIAVRDNFKKIF